jgi:hypothetical protein
MTNPYRELPYEVYLTTEHWRKTRERKLAQVDNCCENCPRVDSLEVHHLTYVRLGEELTEDLRVLCPICHREAHGIEPTIEDWRRARFMYGHETIKASRQMRVQRQMERKDLA